MNVKKYKLFKVGFLLLVLLGLSFWVYLNSTFTRYGREKRSELVRYTQMQDDIDFYGRIVNENGEPLANAEIEAEIHCIKSWIRAYTSFEKKSRIRKSVSLFTNELGEFELHATGYQLIFTDITGTEGNWLYPFDRSTTRHQIRYDHEGGRLSNQDDHAVFVMVRENKIINVWPYLGQRATATRCVKNKMQMLPMQPSLDLIITPQGVMYKGKQHQARGYSGSDWFKEDARGRKIVIKRQDLKQELEQLEF